MFISSVRLRILICGGPCCHCRYGSLCNSCMPSPLQHFASSSCSPYIGNLSLPSLPIPSPSPQGLVASVGTPCDAIFDMLCDTAAQPLHPTAHVRTASAHCLRALALALPGRASVIAQNVRMTHSFIPSFLLFVYFSLVLSLPFPSFHTHSTRSAHPKACCLCHSCGRACPARPPTAQAVPRLHLLRSWYCQLAFFYVTLFTTTAAAATTTTTTQTPTHPFTHSPPPPQLAQLARVSAERVQRCGHDSL